MSWPTLENGTVDWATVFDDPETGLIAMIDRADTPDKLRACYHVAIHGLFSRELDVEVRNRYLHELDKYFTIKQDERHVTGLKKQIANLFHEIMRIRVERARAYAVLKEYGEERRIPNDDPLDLLKTFGGE
jgi:hypothetical protein